MLEQDQASPNPIKDIVKISSEREIKNIKIMDLNGREIANFHGINTREYEINMANFVTGIYLLRISTSERTFFRKVIKD